MKGKLYVVIVFMLLLFIMGGCTQDCDAVFFEGSIEEWIAEIGTTVDLEVVECSTTIEVDDLTVKVEKLAIWLMANSGNGEQSNFLVIDIGVDYSGIGSCKMSDVIAVAVYSKDLSFKYSLDTSTMNQVISKNGEKTVDKYYFKIEQRTFNSDDDRIFILISDKLYELVDCKCRSCE